jgi:4-nitrophenyl phosphatase
MIFDLDGTIYDGGELIPGAVDFIHLLTGLGITVRYYTNRSAMTPVQIADKLNRLNLEVFPEQVITSSLVTAPQLRGRKVFLIGGGALRTALENENVDFSDENPDSVVFGHVDSLTRNTLKTAVRLIHHRGAGFIATNGDPWIIEHGMRVPGNGAFVAALETASSRKAEIFGKPHPAGIDMILNDLILTPGEVMILGDNEATDIECGIRAGVRTALILTGVTSTGEAAESKADWVVKDYSELSERILNDKGMV